MTFKVYYTWGRKLLICSNKKLTASVRWMESKSRFVLRWSGGSEIFLASKTWSLAKLEASEVLSALTHLGGCNEC